MKIVEKKVNELIPYINNPRNNENAVDAVASSIKNFGFKQPIVIDKKNEIVAGHTRLLAAKKLGLETVPCLIADDLNDAQIKAFRLADNKVAEIATWNESLLQQELEELQNMDLSFDMTEFGFQDVSNMNVDEPLIAEEDNFDIDESFSPSTSTKKGDVFQLGNHRLMCGDSTDINDVKILTGGVAIDLVVTDPPYNVNYQGSTKDKLTIQNDNFSSDQDFEDFLTAAFECMYAVMRDGAAFYIWHASKSTAFQDACQRAMLSVRQTLIWNKNQFVMGRQDYHWKHEPCLYGWKEGAGHYFVNNRKLSTIIEDGLNIDMMSEIEAKELLAYIFSEAVPTTIINADKPKINKEHPTMKPIPLIGKNIQNSSKAGDSVLDLFGGSGSTMIACEQLKRRCFMMELDPHYVDVIIKRWETLTGEEAVKLN